MRLVMVGFVLVIVGCRDERASGAVDAATKTPTSAATATAAEKIDWSWVTVSRGVAVRTGSQGDVGPPSQNPFMPRPMKLSVFPADQPTAAAIKTIDSPSVADAELPAGKYELCSGRDPAPKPDGGWRMMSFCQRFDVDTGVAKITASGGAMGSVGFTCATESSGVCK